MRRQTPYGVPRGNNPSWPNQKGFVGGDIEPTGLTHLGARDYDSTAGRFISVDPVMDLTDPQQMHGYAYGHNSPVTFSDPTGLIDCDFERCGSGGEDLDTGRSGGGKPGGGRKDPPTPKSFNDPDTWTGTMNGKPAPAPGEMTLEYGVWLYANGPESMVRHHISDLSGAELNHIRVKVFCYNNPRICEDWRKAEEKAFEKQIGMLVAEATGIPDVWRCLHGSVSGCAWTAVGAIPYVGKAIGAVKAGVKTGIALNRISKFCSFTADTRVLMADRTTKPISKVRVGDKAHKPSPTCGSTPIVPQLC